MRWFRSTGSLSALVVALAAALAACDDGGVAPAGPVAVQLEPAGPLLLGVGDTATLRATAVNAGRDPAVRFRSSDTTIATVSAAGLVTGVKRGSATVIARSAQDTAAQAAVVVRVVDETTLPPTSARPAISLESLVDAQNRLVRPDSIRGLVFVRLAVERGSAVRAEVMLGGVVGCTLGFPATTPDLATAEAALSLAPVTLACPLDTGRFDPRTGVPAFDNGPAVLSARLVGADGATLASVGAVQLVLRNLNALAATLSAPRTATDSAGRAWVDGDLTVTALPVSYDASAGPARVTFTYRRPGGPELTLADAEAPFAVVFREGVELQGVVDDSLRITVSSTAGGQVGPRVTAGPVRYDNRPPAAGTLAAREWVAAATEFAALYAGATQPEAGVGSVSVRFFAGSPALTAAELVARGQEVAAGDDLAEADLGGYALAAQVCDALGNCVVVDGFDFGVDLTPPVIGSTQVEHLAINPRQDLSLGVADNLSGFGARPVLAAVSVLDEDPGTAACGPTVEGVDLPGRAAGGACAPDTAGAVIRVPRVKAGYYTYLLEPLDRAGNRGGPDTIAVLVDTVAPTLGPLSLPATLVGGDPLALTVQAADNLDLALVSLRLVFPAASGSGSLALPFGVDTVGAAFDGALDPSAAASLRTPHFVRTLTYSTAGGSAGAWPTVVIDSVQAWAVDAARLVARQGAAVPASWLGGVNLDPFRAITAVAPSLSTTRFCARNCLPTDPTSATVTLRITSGTSSGAPFARVYFFEERPDGFIALVGSAGSPTETSDTGTQRVTTYAFSFRPGAGRLGDHRVFAVGVTSNGAALRSADVPITLFAR